MSTDLYARRKEDVLEPPVGLWNTLRFLGPGLILVGSVVGSGEIMMTTSLGASVGFTMLWWMLLSCWGKSIVQAELARYAVSAGETVLHAFNRLPGKLPAPKGKVSWFIYLWLFTLIPGFLGGGGIYGGSGQAVHLAFPQLPSEGWTVILAALASVLILSGTYRFLEKLLTFMVATFTFLTLFCAIVLQFTEYAITWADVRAGLRFEFPAFAVGAALAAYGGTGVTAGEAMAYTYWCIEKGYARYTGPTERSADWVRRARGWIRVMQTDVALTLIVLTCATVPFYMLGAGVLHRMQVKPEGLDTIKLLSHIYTKTLGEWAWWLFMLAAFFILYSTVISGLGGGARMIADCMGVLGWIDPRNYRARLAILRLWAVVSPAITATCYFFVKNPIWMLTVAGVVSAAMGPIVAGGTIYLRYAHLDRRIAPTWKSDVILWVCFLIMLALAGYTIYRQFF
jgi:Mn2+/Fe2+ NRAMP family transporter